MYSRIARIVTLVLGFPIIAAGFVWTLVVRFPYRPYWMMALRGLSSLWKRTLRGFSGLTLEEWVTYGYAFVAFATVVGIVYGFLSYKRPYEVTGLAPTPSEELQGPKDTPDVDVYSNFIYSTYVETPAGVIIPRASGCSAHTGEGALCWDSDSQTLYVGNGTVAEPLAK